MRWNTLNIEKVSVILKIAGLPSIHAMVKEAEVCDMTDIRDHVTTERDARAAARSLAEMYGEDAIKYWEDISNEEFAERLATI